MQRFIKTHRDGEPALAPGALRLRVVGFDQQLVVSVNAILSAIDSLPGFHLRGLREICYAANPLAGDLCGLYPHHFSWLPKAEFIQRERRIVFYEISDFELFHHVLYHEIGHFVFFLVINSRVKKRWVTEIYPQSSCVTPYGKSSACEDFAESYATYVHQPDLLKPLAEKYAFMRDWVFSGRRETLKETSERKGQSVL